MFLLAFAVLSMVQSPALRPTVSQLGSANQVWVVDSTGFGDFTDLQPAIDAATDGDTILVRNSPPCCYPSFEIVGKGLTLVGIGPGPRNVAGGKVRDLPAGSEVVLSGLDINWGGYAGFGSVGPTLTIQDCVAAVRVQNCRIEGYGDEYYEPARDAVVVGGSPNVVFDGCTIAGGNGPYYGPPPLPGRHGLLVVGSVVVLYDSFVIGGTGGAIFYFPSFVGFDGGHGIIVTNGGELYASDSVVSGGYAGDGGGGMGGTGIIVGAGSLATGRNLTVIPGPPGYYGGTTGLGVVGDLTTVSTFPRSFEMPNFVPEWQPLVMRVTGLPGDLVSISISDESPILFVGDSEGYDHTGMPIAGGAIDLGQMPSSGEISFALPAPAIPVGGSTRLFAQAVLTTPGGDERHTASRAVEWIDEGVFDDCPVTIFVDRANFYSGNGRSWMDAFRDLDDGLALARLCPPSTLVEIWLAQGVYTPDVSGGDREKRFELRSRTTLLGGFAGVETKAEDRRPDLYPTILSADLDRDDDIGGGRDDNAYGVLRAGSAAEPVDTVLIDGVTIQGGERSDASFDRGGGLAIAGQVDLQNLVIRDNRARHGGGIYVVAGQVKIVNCRLLENEGTSFGGGICIQDAASSVELAQSVIVANSAHRGGGIYAAGSLDVRDSTIVGNDATRGAGIQALTNGLTMISNTILWSNESAELSGQEAQLYSSKAGQILIDACCVQNLDGTLGGLGNIGRNPRFLALPDTTGPGGALAFDLRLGPASACIDSGFDDAVALDATDLDGDGDTLEPLPVDLAGRPRFISARPRQPGAGTRSVVDIGAFEAPAPRSRRAEQ